MAYAQGLVDLVTQRREKLEAVFNSNCDFFKLFEALEDFVKNQQNLLIGYTHDFGKKSPMNDPVLNDMIAIWFEMKQWKRELEDEQKG